MRFSGLYSLLSCLDRTYCNKDGFIRKIYSRLERGWSVTSQLGAGKRTFLQCTGSSHRTSGSYLYNIKWNHFRIYTLPIAMASAAASLRTFQLCYTLKWNYFRIYTLPIAMTSAAASLRTQLSALLYPTVKSFQNLYPTNSYDVCCQFAYLSALLYPTVKSFQNLYSTNSYDVCCQFAYPSALLYPTVKSFQNLYSTNSYDVCC